MSFFAYRSLALACCLLCFPLQAYSATEVKEVHQVFPLEPNGEFSLSTFKGQVKLAAWERNEVKLDAKIEMDESSDCGSAEQRADWVRKTEVKIESAPNSVRVESDYSKLESVQGSCCCWSCSCTSNPLVNYEIMLPAHARVRLRDHKSSIQISNIQGAINLSTHKGKVDLRGIEGSLELATHKGEVQVAFNKWTQASRISTHKGEVEIKLPKNSAFELDAAIGRRGEFQSDFPGTERTGKGVYHAPVNGGGPALRLATQRGQFRLRQL